MCPGMCACRQGNRESRSNVSCMTSHVSLEWRPRAPELTAISTIQCVNDTRTISLSWDPGEKYIVPHPNMSFIVVLKDGNSRSISRSIVQGKVSVPVWRHTGNECAVLILLD